MRRKLFGKLGLYKLGYDIAADYELLIRYLRKAGVKARYLNECVVRMRMGGKSTRGWQSFMTLNCINRILRTEISYRSFAYENLRYLKFRQFALKISSAGVQILLTDNFWYNMGW